MISAKRVVLNGVLFVVVMLAVINLIPLTCEDCDRREINPAYHDWVKDIQDGDIILTNSNDFLSRMIEDVQGCGYSGMKIAHNVGGVNHLIVSDIEDLYDLDGGLHLAIFRPNRVSAMQKNNLQTLFARAASATFLGNRVTYDLAYDVDNKSHMMCSQMVYEVYGNAVMDRARGDKAAWFSALGMCDMRQESVTQIGGWIRFWKE
jgi:hypothetical protein